MLKPEAFLTLWKVSATFRSTCQRGSRLRLPEAFIFANDS